MTFRITAIDSDVGLELVAAQEVEADGVGEAVALEADLYALSGYEGAVTIKVEPV